MKLNSILLILLLSQYSKFTSAQDTLILNNEEKDKTVELLILSNNGTDIARWNTWFGINLNEDNSIGYGGTSFYIPKKVLFNLTYGFGIKFDGSVSIANREKDYILNQSVDQDLMTRYMAKIPSKKIQSIGIHYGIGHSNLFKIINESASHIRFGIQLLGAKHAHWKLSTQYLERKGGNRKTLSLDALWYFNHLREYKPNSSLYSSIYEFNIYNENDFMPFGFGITYEGYSNYWTRKGVSGIKYQIGAGSGPFRSISYYFQFGIGLNLSFY